jgi:hypothetical protein
MLRIWTLRCPDLLQRLDYEYLSCNAPINDLRLLQLLINCKTYLTLLQRQVSVQLASSVVSGTRTSTSGSFSENLSPAVKQKTLYHLKGFEPKAATLQRSTRFTEMKISVTRLWTISWGRLRICFLFLKIHLDITFTENDVHT